jgi:aspartoacylase
MPDGIATALIPFDTVVIVGGTHGNERTGVSLVHHWQQAPGEVQRAGFATRLLLANPEAVRQNRRFIDCDLNRSFLAHQKGAGYERERAREIRAWIEQAGRRTFVVDLHTTTANMGITLITDTDPVNLAVAAEVQDAMAASRIYCFADSDRINSCLRASARGGIGVEIGPIAQGILRHDTLALTREVVQRILDAVEGVKRGLRRPEGTDRMIYLHDRHVAYPTLSSGDPPVFIHRALQGRDYAPLTTGQPVFQDLGGRTWTFEEAEMRYPVFINEAAYYHEDIAFSLTRRIALRNLYPLAATVKALPRGGQGTCRKP